MNSRLRLLAWQIDLIAYERGQGPEGSDDTRGHVAKWEGGGPQNRYERVRFSPWPKIIQGVWSFVRRGRRQAPELQTQPSNIVRWIYPET